MTEQDRNKYEEACINRYAGIFKNDSFYEKERVKSCFMSGCEFAHSLLEERIKEDRDRTIEEVIEEIRKAPANCFKQLHTQEEFFEELKKLKR